jgi:hypothetical protein
MSSPLARRLCGDPVNLSRKLVPVGLSSGGKSCSNSIFIGESANVTLFFSSVRTPVSDSIVAVFRGGGVVHVDSEMVLVVALPVDEGGGVGSRIIAFAEV